MFACAQTEHFASAIMIERSSLDTLSARRRSALMRRIRSRDTEPEMRVRRLVHGMGYRYRLHVKDLPGCPDLVFRPRRKAIFVHGCFWHQHVGCSRSGIPKSPERRDYWQAKLTGNVLRDRRNEKALQAMNWRSLVVWECETKDLDQLAEKIKLFLS